MKDIDVKNKNLLVKIKNFTFLIRNQDGELIDKYVIKPYEIYMSSIDNDPKKFSINITSKNFGDLDGCVRVQDAINRSDRKAHLNIWGVSEKSDEEDKLYCSKIDELVWDYVENEDETNLTITIVAEWSKIRRFRIVDDDGNEIPQNCNL